MKLRHLKRITHGTLTSIPLREKPIGCKWVYKKYKSYGTNDHYKTRLVAKSFTQIEGLNYHENLLLVAKLVTIRCLRVVIAVSNSLLYQLDVNNAFLHSGLYKEVYMKIPFEFFKHWASCMSSI